MSDLIRRADAIKAIEARVEDKYNQNDYEFGRNQAFEGAIMELEDLPTIDAVEVKHGEWIGDGFNPLACSICGATTDAIKGIRWADRFYKYCPNCGAKMDGEVKNDG